MPLLSENAKARLSHINRSIGLRARFIMIGIAVLVPLVVVMLQLAQYERESAIASAEQRVKLFASLTANRQQQLLQRAQIVLSQVASDWQVLAGGDNCTEAFNATMARHAWIVGFRFSAPDGTRICADGPEIMEPDISGRSYFRDALTVQDFVVSGQIVSRGAGSPIIVAAVPVSETDRLIGVLSAAIELDAIADLLPIELRSNPGVVVDVIDRSGVLLARYPGNPEIIGRPHTDKPVVQRALKQPGGVAELPDLEGATRLFAFQNIDNTDWTVAVGISRASVVGPIDAALHQRLALIAAIVLSSCVIGLIGGEAFVFWPLRVLARTAQALERGEMAARPPLTGLSEVGALERSLNSMAEAIEQREADLKASQAAWEQAVRDAKRANDAKSQFLASMSHEIRTPLSGIVGYNDLLLAQDLAPVQRRYVERIEAAAAAMISVIDGILDIARIEAGEVEIEQRPFALSALVDNAISMIRPRADHKGLDLSFKLDPQLSTVVLGDETRLSQVLLNLLTNAVKFTPSGTVTLRIYPTAERHVRFSIADTGIGIAREQHQKLFKRYSQAHDVSRGHDGGAGLGLAICKQLTGLMGGQLGFSSQPGRGSTFWVELELPPTEASEIERQPAPTRALKTGRILVADDDEMNREITSAMLTLAGHEVDVVIDGAQAVEAVRKKAYDLVLLDIEMRRMSGVEAARHIRELEAPTRHVPVIAMTANVLPQQVRTFEAAGMDGHLGKPFTRNQLIDKVNLFLSARSDADSVARLSAENAAILDEHTMAELKALVDERRMAEWIRTLLTELQSVLSIGDEPISRDKLAKTAHALVSQAGSLGFVKLSRLSSELEEACIRRADYADALDGVKQASREVIARINQMQNSGQPPLT